MNKTIAIPLAVIGFVLVNAAGFAIVFSGWGLVDGPGDRQQLVVVAATDLEPGQPLTMDMVTTAPTPPFQTSHEPVAPEEVHRFEGQRIVHFVPEGTVLFTSTLERDSRPDANDRGESNRRTDPSETDAPSRPVPGGGPPPAAL